MAVVLDTVAYDVAHTPSDALKSIWISSGVPANLRKDLADQSIVTVELFAALADTQLTPSQTRQLMQLAAAWL